MSSNILFVGLLYLLIRGFNITMRSLRNLSHMYQNFTYLDRYLDGPRMIRASDGSARGHTWKGPNSSVVASSQCASLASIWASGTTTAVGSTAPYTSGMACSSSSRPPNASRAPARRVTRWARFALAGRYECASSFLTSRRRVCGSRVQGLPKQARSRPTRVCVQTGIPAEAAR